MSCRKFITNQFVAKSYPFNSQHNKLPNYLNLNNREVENNIAIEKTYEDTEQLYQFNQELG